MVYNYSILSDTAVESPRSGGPIQDKLALEACSNLRSAGYHVLAWRPYCDHAMPFMDRKGNTLLITHRPYIESWPEIGATLLRQQNSELKSRAIGREAQEIRHNMWQSDITVRSLNSSTLQAKKKDLAHQIIQENVKELSSLYMEVKDLEAANNIGNKDQRMAKLLEGLLSEMALSVERRRAEYIERQAIALEKEDASTKALRRKQKIQDRYDEEYTFNVQSRRLVEVASHLKEVRDRAEDSERARWEAVYWMDAAKQNLL